MVLKSIDRGGKVNMQLKVLLTLIILTTVRKEKI